MSARIELLIEERFNVLCRITWDKENNKYGAGQRRCRKEDLRSYWQASENIIFCEHHGADNIAKGEVGYQSKCDELRGFVFEPLRAYLDGEKDRAGFTTRQVAENYQKKTGSRTVTGMAGHWFSSVQWTLPTEENYTWLRDLFNANGTEYLRRDYEELRRPFSVTAEVPYTDVWNYEVVQHYKGKHICEKPLIMLQDIIRASSRPGDVVLDCFAGSGNTGLAADSLDRDSILIENDPVWCERIAGKISGRVEKETSRVASTSGPVQISLF